VFIRVETSSGVPITRQIADQLRAQCASGLLNPGDRLPSVRELAGRLAVNQNTILKVYERLAMEGLLEMRRGDGTYITDRLPRRPMRQPRQQLAEEARRLVQHAQMLGVAPHELHTLLDEALDKQTPSPAGKD
jgi:GntR family transcriptional regulator